MERGQFKSGTEVLSFLEIVGSFLSFYIILQFLSPQRAWRPFPKHEVIKFGWSDDYEWSKPENDRLENGRIWLQNRYTKKLKRTQKLQALYTVSQLTFHPLTME